MFGTAAKKKADDDDGVEGADETSEWEDEVVFIMRSCTSSLRLICGVRQGSEASQVAKVCHGTDTVNHGLHDVDVLLALLALPADEGQVSHPHCHRLCLSQLDLLVVVHRRERVE